MLQKVVVLVGGEGKLKSLILKQMALSGPDPDPNKSIAVHRNSVSLSRKEKPKGTFMLLC